MIDDIRAKLGPASIPYILIPNKTSVIGLLSNNHIWGSKPNIPISWFKKEFSALPNIKKNTAAPITAGVM